MSDYRTHVRAIKAMGPDCVGPAIGELLHALDSATVRSSLASLLQAVKPSDFLAAWRALPAETRTLLRTGGLPTRSDALVARLGRPTGLGPIPCECAAGNLPYDQHAESCPRRGLSQEWYSRYPELHPNHPSMRYGREIERTRGRVHYGEGLEPKVTLCGIAREFLGTARITGDSSRADCADCIAYLTAHARRTEKLHWLAAGVGRTLCGRNGDSIIYAIRAHEITCTTCRKNYARQMEQLNPVEQEPTS